MKWVDEKHSRRAPGRWCCHRGSRVASSHISEGETRERCLESPRAVNATWPAGGLVEAALAWLIVAGWGEGNSNSM